MGIRLPPDEVSKGSPIVWENQSHVATSDALRRINLKDGEVSAARSRWERFAPLLAHYFPEIRSAGGLIDSPLIRPPERFARSVLRQAGKRLLVKCDHMLPVAGSIKARGGVYEVLVHAERLAKEAGLIGKDVDRLALSEPAARGLFSQHKIVVGSTGNLGFSVGTIARAMGSEAEVHMSADAKGWKKDRLRKIGVKVVEHPGDYSSAVARARVAAEVNPNSYFVDDENSVNLFLGYAVAAYDLARQLSAEGVRIDEENRLVVHLPCGVGGAPGGITFGLKQIFGDAVISVFAEPVGAPCFLVQLAAGTEKFVSVYDVGLSNSTEADGLAVPAASMFVVSTVHQLVDACVTVRDQSMFLWAFRAWRDAGLRLEPSSAAGFASAAMLDLWRPPAATSTSLLRATKGDAVHVVWTTGGALLPDDEFVRVLECGRSQEVAEDG